MRRSQTLLILFIFFFSCNKNRKRVIELDNQSLQDVSIEDLKNGHVEIEKVNNPFTEQWKQKESEFVKFINIFNQNVLEFYSLEEQYDTPLKKKFLRESQDYQEKLNKLKNLKAEILSKTFYIDWTPRQNSINGDTYFKYDLSSKTFTVQKWEYKYNDYSKNTRFILFSHIVFNVSEKFHKTTELVSSNFYGGPEEYRKKVQQNVSFKITDENTALKIEENKNSINILFIFKIIGVSDDVLRSIKVFKTDLKKIAVYDCKTDEIYALFDYK